MNKAVIISGMLLLLGLGLSTPTIAQTAATGANQDFIIVLDESGSMREKVPGDPKRGYEENPLAAAKVSGALEALNDVVDNILKEGDYFALVTFGDSGNLVYSQPIQYPHERKLFKETIQKMPFRDKHTDILMGLKKSGDLLSSLDPNRRKILVMVTDGKNEPPPGSPYLSEEISERAYAELRDLIQKNKWDIRLVGLGEYTDITDIARKLNLPKSSAIVLSQLQGGQQISDILQNIVDEIEQARVDLETRPLTLRLKPKLWGGYESVNDSLTIKSAYQKDSVEIQLDSRRPLQVEGDGGLTVAVQPLSLTLAPQQSSPFNLNFSFTGQRPKDGRITGKIIFQLTPESKQFYPVENEFEVYVPSWMDTYWPLAAAVIVGVMLLLGSLLWGIRKALAPEIKITLTADGLALGSAITLKKKGTFSIGTDAFSSSHVFLAKNLTCKTAITGKYLGRKKFLIQAAEAKIIDDNKEVERLVVGLDKMFDVKDAQGKTLRGVTITKPGKGSDAFGSGGSSGDPFK